MGTSTGSVTRTPPRGSEESLGGELGDPLDTLDVYLATQAIGSTPFWRSRAKDGLKPPDMRLLAEFRSKVEAAAKKKP
jgi:hypothetical protein